MPRSTTRSKPDTKAIVDYPDAPITGKALLQKVDSLSHNLSRREIAINCGYYTLKHNEPRARLGEFYDALLAAKGVTVSPDGAKDGRGREPTYRVTVHQNGQIVIGATYTKEMNLQAGDEFEIKLGYKHIKLKKIDRDHPHADGDDFDPDDEFEDQELGFEDDEEFDEE